MLKLFDHAKGCICIEDNKPDCIAKLTEMVKDEPRIEVCTLKTKYPQGAERCLIAAVSGREINSSMLPADAGCVVDNIDTVCAVYRAVMFGEPVMDRIVTITGDAVADPCNFKVRLGSSFAELLEAAGGLKQPAEKIISGGPMMGFAMFDYHVPVVKTSSAMLCMSKDEVSAQEPGACINCGRCVSACPARLIPSRLATYSEHGQEDLFVKYHGMECVECGCCSYTCPAKRPLTQSVRSMRKTVLANRKKPKLLHVSSSPHVRDKVNTGNIMLTVLIALLPSALFGVYNFGPHALMLILVSILCCVATEAVYEKIVHKKLTIQDYSAAVTGLLLALNLPPNAPWWIAVIGSAFAILVVKQLFGGLGQNIMNPALAARCFLLISFTGRMTDFAVPKGAWGNIADTVSGATPLAALKAGESVNWVDLFFGNIQGTIGETSALAILIGAVILLVRGVIDLRIPLTYIGSFAIFVLLFGGHGFDMNYLLCHLFGGGLMLGAWFMATDYVTTPITKKGQLVYGVCLGVFTGLFRIFGGSAEGVSYAIIFCNLLVPIIERFTMPVAFGKGGKKA